ncbi:hypothetical protein MVES1_000275 [Malassezia vespertilionis]|uniref:Uncharacterized protein n=1 Tax=Malassezia vespertilionis TaxID=2020962 RepID=A0A2N1JGC8_9BASI|nr:uncharacterized protein MVES1_000275 [Malassezia vespertilionis]PKI85600.1 hypothetical protein MVES_000260 [Malassezia vespertilionis]WFD04950.1 hypothetical protein MVES1_000275 [Malassezia vespertilionis]
MGDSCREVESATGTQSLPLSIPQSTTPAASAALKNEAHVDHAAERISGASESPRTPSPILGSQDSAAIDPISGHHPFPQVGLGIGTLEHEMQLLMGLEDGEEGHVPPDRPSDVLIADVLDKLEQMDVPTESAALRSKSMPEKERQLALILLELAHCVRQQDEARDKLKHQLRVTRLASLSLFSSLRISYSHMLSAERDIHSRLEVELSGSKSQSKMLSDMVSRASLNGQDTYAIPAEAEVLDDELRRPPSAQAVTERNKLLADKRHLRQRVRDAEAQVTRLEAELRSLRPMLLRQSSFEEEMPLESRTPTRNARRRREAMMGDAKSEHLLLASRMLRTLRHAARSNASPSTSPSKYEVRTDRHSPVTPRRTREIHPSTPTPRPKIATDLHEAGRSVPEAHAPWSASSGSNAPFTSGIDELLHAAQSLTGPEPSSDPARHPRESFDLQSSPTHVSPLRSQMCSERRAPVSAPVLGSPKRRRVSLSHMDLEDGCSERDRPWAHRSAHVHETHSALDLLADQAASHEYPHSSLKTPARANIAAMHRQMHANTQPHEPSSWAVVPGAKSASATKPKVGGNQSPEKRLPYVRWSAEEDTKLRRAIKEHGQRWEHVARAVGTRSYHQCRQRYLLMRRKEAAANGLTSPSKNQARTPTRPPSSLASNGPVQLRTPSKTHDDEPDSSTGSDDEARVHAKPYNVHGALPMIPQPQFVLNASPHAARYDRPRNSAPLGSPHHRTSPPRGFARSRVGPVLYS